MSCVLTPNGEGVQTIPDGISADCAVSEKDGSIFVKVESIENFGKKPLTGYMFITNYECL